jgi:hypothetical protein
MVTFASLRMTARLKILQIALVRQRVFEKVQQGLTLIGFEFDRAFDQG